MIEKDPSDTVTRRIRTRATARELRGRATVTEQRIWGMVRRRRVDGLLFRRQHPIGPYIVDFVCQSARLIVEIDGEIHEQQREYDAERDEYLHTRGYVLLRFSADRVLNDLTGILSEIRVACVSPPLPRTGEGISVRT